jgi:hypothetical protein
MLKGPIMRVKTLYKSPLLPDSTITCELKPEMVWEAMVSNKRKKDMLHGQKSLPTDG